MDDRRAREGIEHLQAAAREVIQAARAMLDVAEELIDDPEAIGEVVGTVASVVRQALGVPLKDPDAGGDEPRVERIKVS